MKIIFLDIDGVMNSGESMMASSESNDELRKMFFDTPNETSISALNEIIKQTGAEVVISSTWRLKTTPREIWRMLWLCGFKGKVIGFTPRLPGCIRGAEIKKWLEPFTNVESFVILDDDRDMGSLMYRLYHIDNEKGLTKNDVEPIIEMLNEVYRDEEENFQKEPLGITLVDEVEI